MGGLGKSRPRPHLKLLGGNLEREEGPGVEGQYHLPCEDGAQVEDGDLDGTLDCLNQAQQLRFTLA